MKWYAAGRFPEKFAVGVERHAFRGPIEAIFVIAVCGTETDGRRFPDVHLWDFRTGVDDKEEGSGLSGILIQLGEKLEVNLLCVVVILDVPLEDGPNTAAWERYLRRKKHRMFHFGPCTSSLLGNCHTACPFLLKQPRRF